MTDDKNLNNQNLEATENEEEIETIVFEDQDGNEVEFVDIGCFDYEGKEYLALAPYGFMNSEGKCASGDCEGNCEECDEGEGGGLLYCEIVSKGDGEEELVPVNDDDLNDALHATFCAMMQSQMDDAGEETEE